MRYIINTFWVFCALSMFVLMANRSGRGALAGEALTLAPGEGGRTCSTSGCHGSGTPFGTQVAISLLDLDGNSISSYEAGQNYRVNLNITATGASGYGFMLVCLDGNDQAVNNWGPPPSQIRSVNIFGRDYLEHTTRLSESSYEFDWTAPASGTGDVIFYAAGNAVNGNNSTSGDNANTTSMAFSESIMSGVDDQKRETVQIFPNPVRDELNVITSGNSTIRIVNMAGRTIHSYQSSMNENSTMDLSALAPGSYFVRILDKDLAVITTKRIVKVD